MYSVAGRTSVASRCYSFGIPGYLWDKKIYINFSILSLGYLRRGDTCTLILQYIGYHHLSRVTVVFHISLRNLSIYCTSTLNECIYIPGCCIQSIGEILPIEIKIDFKTSLLSILMCWKRWHLVRALIRRVNIQTLIFTTFQGFK